MLNKNRLQHVTEFAVGLLLGLGLMLWGMTDGQPKALVFVLAILFGMLGFELMGSFVHAPRKVKLNAA